MFSVTFLADCHQLNFDFCYFVYIVSEKGQMYTFGDGRHGKLALGQDSFSNVFIPKKVERFQKFCVEKVGLQST